MSAPPHEIVNRQVRLAARPTGLPGPEVWDHTTETVGEPAGGQFVVRVSHISLDPAMRGWMNDVTSYVPPVGIGAVMRALAAGDVVSSNHPDFPVGACVTGLFGAQEYAVSDGTDVQRVDPAAASLPTYLAMLGMTGMTAYFGLFDVGALREGETVLVSGAAGAVGSAAGQLAKIKGARVVGIAGGQAKCSWLTGELGFDAAIDYKAGDVRRALRDHVPDGVDVYFDNVGGEILDAALARLRRGARVVLCGAISQYNTASGRPEGPANYLSLLVNRARMEGFIVTDYAGRYGEAAAQMGRWMRDGRLRSHEDVVRGEVADFPETLLRLFRGENTGKLVLQIAG